jgi:triacylglycerol esterase/lipase EstA (alpha/beta hydrolase family)
MLKLRVVASLAPVLATLASAGVASAATVGTSFPAGFPTIVDASLGTPVLGFGAAGAVTRTPVIFLHGNNDTPYPTHCNPYGDAQAFAQYFVDHGYMPREVWGLGYQGDQCDLLVDPMHRSGEAHATLPNVPDLRAFVHAVLAYTGAKEVDIVGHSLGVTLARTWLRLDHAQRLVRRFVAIDGPNHGIINCSPNPLNYWQAPAAGGFTPDSAICRD